MVYRPTVRYANDFKDYVDQLFQATTLDRNQIIRAALFSAPFSPAFKSILSQSKKKDVPLPPAPWSMDYDQLWMEQNPSNKEGGKDVDVNKIRRKEIERTPKRATGSSKNTISSDQHSKSVERREGEIPSKRILLRDQGGISITIG
jgi:hypothetical protein